MTLEEIYRLLRSGHVQAQGIVDTIQCPLVVLDRALQIENCNPAFLDVFEVPSDELMGRDFFEAGQGRWDNPALRDLLHTVIPNAFAVLGFELTVNTLHGGTRTMLISARRLPHPNNGHQQLLIVFEDVTSQRASLAKQELIAAEIKHRFKNFLALVSSLARQSQADGLSVAEYRDTLLGRIEALAEAEMGAFAEDGTSLQAIISRVTMPYEGRVMIRDCPSLDMDPQPAASLSMVLHELATNAAKHGALSVQGGQVIVTMSSESAQDAVELVWKEEGGPPVPTDSKPGFGSKLIQLMVSEQLRGKIDIQRHPDGIVATLMVPLHPK